MQKKIPPRATYEGIKCKDCGEAEIMQDAGSEIFVIEKVFCAANIVGGMLMVYGIKQQWR